MGGKVDGENWEDQEEETLSLCDLPVNGEDRQNIEKKCLELEDFQFGSWGGSVLAESEMCAADDVFFQGQILPLRLSVSSESGLTGARNPSRTESMDRYFTSASSRSSSSRSLHSSCTTTSTTTSYKPKLRNQFHSHSHPSPKPQVWLSEARSGHPSRSRKSNVWGLFRVGLVRTPEMELHELKRSFNSRSSSSSSNSKGSSNGGTKSDGGEKVEKKNKITQKFLFESCKCSVDAVEIVPEKIVLVKNNKNRKNCNEEKEKKQSKQALHQRRTFEWLKELSITDLPVETHA